MVEQLTGTVVAEKYRLDTLLRSGEVGDFYRGRHLFMDKPVTLKVLPASLALDDNIREQFTAEARSASALSNPHILAANDFGSNVDKSFYVVYEGFDGEPLKNSIGVGGQFSAERAASIARQIAAALNTANENGFIHGNLTPDSILVSHTADAASVKVFDFDPATDGYYKRPNHRSPFSIAYLAPENFSGFSNVDARSDIYSLGIILYQMLTGEVPFKGETPTDVMLKHAEEEMPAMSEYRSDVPPTLEAVLKKALAKNPDERHQTAAEFVEDLDKAVAAGANTGRRFWMTAAAVIVGIGLLASALIYGTSSKQTVPTTQLQPDAEGQPVQPINPATGSEEMALVSMPGAIPGSMSNTDILAQPPVTLPSGGDNYNPWATGVAPPGAPPMTYVPPGGGSVSGDPNSGSPFMGPLTGADLVCKDIATGAIVQCPSFPSDKPAAKPSPTPRTPPANTETQPAQPPSDAKPQPEKPAANTGRPPASIPPKPTPTPRSRPARPGSSLE